MGYSATRLFSWIDVGYIDLIWGTFSSSRHSYLQCRPVTSGSILSQLFRKGRSIGKGLIWLRGRRMRQSNFSSWDAKLFYLGWGFFTFFTLGFSVALWRHGTEPGVPVVDQSNLYQFQYPCFKFAIILKFKVMRNRNILNSVDYPRLIVSVWGLFFFCNANDA